MGWPKCYEDNLRIAEDRLREIEEMKEMASFQPIVKNRAKTRKANRRDIFCPKKGVIDLVKWRGTFFITMEFRQHLYDEWIAVLKERGWKWDFRKKCWYAICSGTNYDFASQFAHGKPKPDCEADDVYLDGYSRITGKRETHDKNCPTQRKIGVI